MPLEHVRYLSRNDLLAMTCVQYEHVNLSPLWDLLENALLTPYESESVLSARGLPLRYVDGAVQAQSPAHWLAHGRGRRRSRPRAGGDRVRAAPVRRPAAGAWPAAALMPREGVEIARRRRLSAGVPRRRPIARYDAPVMVAHEAPGLGVVAITVAQRGEGGRARVLAHAYPLQPRALGALARRWPRSYGIAPDLHALGRIVLDADGQLGAPDTPLH